MFDLWQEEMKWGGITHTTAQEVLIGIHLISSFLDTVINIIIIIIKWPVW